MRTIRALALALFIAAVPASSRAQIERSTVSRRLNYGVTAGCGSAILFMQDMRVGGYEVESYSTSSDIGFIISAFGRINIDRHYIQTGLSFCHSKSSISFKYEDPEGNMHDQVFSVDGKSFQIPLIFGFNVVKQEPYSLSLYIGPKVSFPLSAGNYSYYSGFGSADVVENFRAVLNATAGVNLSISNIQLCFGYDLGITFPSDGILRSQNPDESLTGIVMKRRTGVLYFSLGLFL